MLEISTMSQLFIDADDMYIMPMMESSIVLAKIPFVLWNNINVIPIH